MNMYEERMHMHINRGTAQATSVYVASPNSSPILCYLSSFPWICECAQSLCDCEVILTYILLSVSVTDTVRLYYILLSVHRACVTEVILIYIYISLSVHRACMTEVILIYIHFTVSAQGLCD